MSKELSAREWIETNEVANLDLPDGTNEMDVEGKVKELCIAFGESYATARLEAYKAELSKWLKSQSDLKGESTAQGYYDLGRMQAYKEVISHLTNNPRAPEYTEAEQNWCGCIRPCTECESKKTNESK